MRNFALDGRLSSVRKFVRQGAQFADIGTDHAHLPLALLSEGRIERAVCSDINEGPLKSAMENARSAGLEDKIKFVLTDGAAALADEGLSDVAIAGMGGELIAAIIDAAPFLKNGDIRLILQPMSRAAHLRRYLCGAGFEISAEDHSYSMGKYYLTLVASYTGEARTLSETEAEFGDTKRALPLSSDARGYFTARLERLKKVARGKAIGCAELENEVRLIDFLEELLKADKAAENTIRECGDGR